MTSRRAAAPLALLRRLRPSAMAVTTVTVRVTVRVTTAAVFAVAAVLGACRPEPADDGSREIVERIVEAETRLACHGFRTVSRGPAGASRETRFRVVHTAADRTYVEWTPSPGADERRRWSTGARTPWVRRPDLLLANYRVTVEAGPTDPVAWRETRRVRIEGRRPGRPSLRLDVDAETWLVLAESGTSFDGQEWMRARFESIEYGAPSEPPSPGPTEDIADRPVTAASEGFVPLAVTALPAGFERLGARESPCGSWVEDFGDGLAAFSVLQRPTGRTADPSPDPSPGASPATSSGDAPHDAVRRSRSLGGGCLSGTVAGVDVTVTGNLADADLQTVYQGLRAAAATH